MAYPPLARRLARRAGAGAARALEGGGPLPADARGQPGGRRRSSSTRARRRRTGGPGIHHVFARTIKDLICRFHAMQGQSVTRIAGWDTHGLPVEIEVEKELELSGKKEIEAFGVQEFNARARESVFKYQARVGDALRPDRVLARLRASLRHLHQRLHRDGVVAARAAAPARPALPRPQDAAVLPALRHGALEPRAGAGLRGRHHQLGVRHLSAGRRLADASCWCGPPRPGRCSRTSRSRCIPELEYGEYQVGDRTLVLATARAGLPSSAEKGAPSFADLGARRTFPGRELAGLRYRRPLELVPLADDRASRVVITGDFVTADDGSGLVHLAPAFGADDYQAGQEHGLALVRAGRTPTGRSREPAGPSSKAGWSPTRRPTTSSSSGSGGRAAGT